jgi:SagB-type dehydrogenase family enzyme
MRSARSSSVGSSAMHDTDQIKAAMRYHGRTKHQFNRYADGPGQLDWANQPNPFRRYEGAPLVRLPLLAAHEAPRSPYYDDPYHRGSVPSAPLTIHTLSRLLQYALAISAWKQAGATRWALRCNPSSGNLHPTEAYLLIGALPGLGDAPGLYHYAPREHGLERRADCNAALRTALMREFPAQAFLVGLSSIHWREAWKYGERAFRYCQHDAGHAIGALRIAAATLGWSAVLLHGLADATIEDLLGLNRAKDFAGAEREHPAAVDRFQLAGFAHGVLDGEAADGRGRGLPAHPDRPAGRQLALPPDLHLTRAQAHDDAGGGGLQRHPAARHPALAAVGPGGQQHPHPPVALLIGAKSGDAEHLGAVAELAEADEVVDDAGFQTGGGAHVHRVAHPGHERSCRNRLVGGGRPVEAPAVGLVGRR